MLITRFAPSPTGRLHLGHAYSALIGHHLARSAGGCFLVRIEDIDPGRCRDEFVAGILEDLAWLGIEWDGPVRRQSEHFGDYAAALDRLIDAGLVYPCFCTRKEIADEVRRSGAAPHGPEGVRYPGTCRRLDPASRAARRAAAPYAWRLDTAAAVYRTGPLVWTDIRRGLQQADPLAFGDVVLARKDAPTSYHLAVSVDDALQGVTDVVRGEDLFAATHVHRLLQAVLGLPTPRYHHHPLLVGSDGKRLAKRDRAATLAEARAVGMDPKQLAARLLAGALPAPI